MEEYGFLGAALAGLAIFTRWLVLKTIEESDKREERLTAELAESRTQFIDHLEKGNREQVDANLAIANNLSRINENMEAHDERAQKRHDTAMQVMQEMSSQLSWYRERHEA